MTTHSTTSSDIAIPNTRQRIAKESERALLLLLLIAPLAGLGCDDATPATDGGTDSAIADSGGGDGEVIDSGTRPDSGGEDATVPDAAADGGEDAMAPDAMVDAGPVLDPISCPEMTPPTGGCVERCVHTRANYTTAESGAFRAGLHPDGNQIAVVVGDSLWVTDVERTGGQLYPLSGRNLATSIVRFSPDGSEVWAGAGGESSVIKVDLASGVETLALTSAYFSFAVAPGGTQAISGWFLVDLPATDAGYPVDSYTGTLLRDTSLFPESMDISAGSLGLIAHRTSGFNAEARFSFFELSNPTVFGSTSIPSLRDLKVAWTGDEDHLVAGSQTSGGLYLIDRRASDGDPQPLTECFGAGCSTVDLDVAGSTVIQRRSGGIYVYACDIPTA